MNEPDLTSLSVLLLCGGRSAEHEVSLASARSVLAASEGLDVHVRVITKGGELLGEGESLELLARRRGGPPGEGDGAGTRDAGPARGPAISAIAESAAAADVVFPLLHGPFGEDGRLQGVLDYVGVPYVGSGVMASAVSMDKLVMKAVLGDARLPQVRYEPVTATAWRHDPQGVLERVLDLHLPLFVKPANLGSSIGIAKVEDRHELSGALEEALAHDSRVIVEEGLVGARELEIAVLGNGEPELSAVGEVRFDAPFYDYDTKYTAGLTELVIPAALPAKAEAELRRLALRVYEAVGAAGLARVDFFYEDRGGTLLVNELNTMPGFTEQSMYPRLWQSAGLAYDDLIRRLLTLALSRGSA